MFLRGLCGQCPQSPDPLLETVKRTQGTYWRIAFKPLHPYLLRGWMDGGQVAYN